MMSVSLNLLVLRAQHPERLASFYEGFGLVFKTESHGCGPEHKSANMNGSVFEIYPSVQHAPDTTGTRLGFKVPSIAAVLTKLGDRAKLISKPQSSPWGLRAVICDPEGHKVEIVESATY